tara:strand:- start:2081 stop:4786 length:2706 start_codon:yes stop_codon:yes gene_type:complete
MEEKDLEKGYAEEAKRLAVKTPQISLKDATKAVAEMTPIVGDAMAAKEIYDELKKEEPNYLVVGILSGTTLIGLIPGVGDVAANLIKKGAELARRIDVDVNALGSTGGNITFRKPEEFVDLPIEQRNVEFKNTDLSIEDFDNLKIFNREEGFGSTGTQSEKRRRIKTVILPIDEALKLFPDRGYTYMDDVGKAYMDSMESSIKKATQGAKSEEFTGFKPYERLRGTKYGKDMTEEDFQFETIARGVGIPFVSVGYNKKGNTLLSTNHEGAHRLLILKKLGHRFAPLDVLFNRELDMKNTNLNRVMKEARNLVGKQEFSLDRKKRQGGKANVVKDFDTAIKPEDYDINFNKGGVAMEKQMELFGEQGGLTDDGMNKDPISGNEVPSGSLAEEVRDDIPAQLSEGEYVVPADVVRFFGVKFFEDLRMQAKQGLAQMEKDGRIGGEPIAVATLEVQADSEQLDPEDEKKLREMIGVNKGGVIHAAEGVLTESDITADTIAKSTNPLGDYGFVGGSLGFPSRAIPTQKTFYHPDGRTYVVRYNADGSLSNPNDAVYTESPWSDTPPSIEQVATGTGGGASPFESEQESSNRERDSSLSQTTLAFSNMEESRRQAENALKVSYGRLAGDPATGKKGISGFNLTMEQYRDLPLSAKIGLIPAELGIDMKREDVQAIIDNAKNPTGLGKLISALGGGVVGAVANAAKNIFTGIGKALNFESRDKTVQEIANAPISGVMDKLDRALLGIRRIDNKDYVFSGGEDVDVNTSEGKAALERIENNRQRVREKALENHLREVENLQVDLQQAEESAGQGDLDTVAQNTAFDQQMQEAQAIARGPSRSSGGNTGGSNSSSSGVFGDGTFYGVGNKGGLFTKESVAKKSGLASKPKAKAKRKKNTKGLGTKPKAT